MPPKPARASLLAPACLPLDGVLSAWVARHGGVYRPPERLTNSPFLASSPFVRELCRTPMGASALLTALTHSLTLLVPNDTFSSPTREFLLTHLLRRHPRSKAFITLNGLVGTLDTNALLYSPIASEPWLPHFDNMSDFLSRDVVTPSAPSPYSSAIIAADVLHTPVGPIPVLIIDQPLWWDGCAWGWAWDVPESLDPVPLATQPTDDGDLLIIPADAANSTQGPRSTPLRAETRLPSAPGSVASVASLQHSFTAEDAAKMRPRGVSSPVPETARRHTIRLAKTRPRRIFVSPALTDAPCFFRVFLSCGANKEILTSTSTFVTKFPTLAARLDLAGRASLLHVFVDGVGRAARASSVELLPSQYDLLLDGLWEYLTTRLYDWLWPPLVERNGGVRCECVAHDRTLAVVLSAHRFLAPHHFDLPALETPAGKAALDQLFVELRRVNTLCAPQRKAQQIFDTFRSATRVVAGLTGSTVSADVLLPTVIYCIVASGIDSLSSTLHYLDVFSPRFAAYPSEVTYYIASLQSAENYLLGLAPAALTIDPVDYRLFHAACTERGPLAREDSALARPRATWGLVPHSAEWEVSQLFANETDVVGGQDAELLLRCYFAARSENEQMRNGR